MGLTTTTTNLSYARNELLKVGESFIFDKVGDMIYYVLTHNDIRIEFNENTARASGEGTYLFANGLSIGMATPGDCQGIKMEFDYGVEPTLTTGRQVHGLDIKMTMDQDWSIATKPYNATVRGARIQAWSEDDVSGRLTGAYINARAEGTSKTIEGYISGLTGPGIIGMQARTELGTAATITSPAAAGILIHHYSKASSVLTGGYRALQIEIPLMGSAASISSTTYGIYIGADWGGGDVFDYGLYIATGTCDNGIGIVVAAATASGRYGIYVNNSYTKTDGGVHKGISSVVTYTPSGGGYSTPIAIVGRVALGANFDTGTGYMWGVQGQLDFGTSKTINQANSVFAGVRGVITGTTPVLTDADEICCFYADNLCETALTGLASGNSSFFRAHLTDQGTAAVDNFLHIWASNAVTNFVHFESCGGMISAGAATHSGTIKKIAILIDEVTYYLTASTAVS